MTTPTELLLSALPDPRRSGDGWAASCPAHEDRQASLSVGTGDDGGALVHCHAGCEPEAIVRALRLTMADLMPSTNGHAAAQRPRRQREATRREENLRHGDGCNRGAHGQARAAVGDVAIPSTPTGQHVGTVCRWDTPEGKANFADQSQRRRLAL